MEVKMIDSTRNAEHILVFSKMTRLKMSSGSFNELMLKRKEELMEEIEYALGTIRSSWEFIDYTFLITGVTRAFTHQLVRHRTGVSFAQQALRVVDASDFEYLSTGRTEGNAVYRETMEHINRAYKELINAGVSPQDARGLLPTNVLTNIMMKINLRALSEMMKTRLCFRAQGEFQNVAKEIRKLVVNTHPWTESILVPHCVETGSCFFKNYTACPIKTFPGGLDADEERLKSIKALWEELDGFEWEPTIAKRG